MYSAPPPQPAPSRRRWLLTLAIYIFGFAAGRGAYGGLRALGFAPNAVIGVLALVMLTVIAAGWTYRRFKEPHQDGR